MTLSQDLRGALARIDGRATTIVGEAEARFSGEPEYISTLIGLVDDAEPMVQSGATWLLKSAMEKGQELSSAETADILDRLDRISEWSAQLHICQFAESLTLNDAGARRLADWLQPLLNHKRPFLRAWSLHALCALGREFSPVRPRAAAALERASDDASASVRARARNIKPF
ncbi:hypothetical protein [Hyphobacterium sp.]|uniref:hypothetical protein n=1 Tax=Hyphobacterium sp. TaxID=2004662 RepID=UPI003BA8B508